MSEPVLRHNQDRKRYEVEVDGQIVGTAAYAKADGTIDFVSTRVDPSFQNQGLAALMAKQALDDARAEGLTVKPSCSYFVIYIKRHPEYSDLVAN